MSDAVRPEYARAAVWYAQVYGTLRASRTAAWVAAAAAAAVALLLALALALLGPLKTGAPYAVPVDGLRGEAETVRALAPGPLTSSPGMAESHLARYVAARESFATDDVLDAWTTVAAWSAPPVLDGYRAQIARTGTNTPWTLYPPGTALEASVRSVSLLSPGTALVRYDTVRRDPAATTGERQGWQATVAYRWSDAPMRSADRHANPLGFTVTSWRRERDGTLPQVVALPPP